MSTHTNFIPPSSPHRHIRVVVSGGRFAKDNEKLREKIVAFHSRLRVLDHNWPYMTYTTMIPRVCTTCGGICYEGENILPSDVKRLARQMKLKVTIERWAPAIKCGKVTSHTSHAQIAVEYTSGDISPWAVKISGGTLTRAMAQTAAKAAGAKGDWVK